MKSMASNGTTRKTKATKRIQKTWSLCFLRIFATIFISSLSAIADTHYVDVNSTTPSAPYTNWVAAATNIQEAVDEAVDGDTVQVADGTYLISAEILVDKGVTVQSVSDETNTIVDAQELCRCFYLDHADAVIEGFTISNGKVTGAGGGVYCSNGTVRNCTIDGNTALEGMDDSSWWGDKAGGGICCDNGLIDACTISNNEATSSLGGGVYLRADAELRDSTVRDNTLLGSGGRARGGGVFSAGGVITGCVIENNIVQGASSGESVQGGGVFQVSSATLSESIIRGNEAIPGYTAGGSSGDGAGILALGSSIVEDCIIEGNIAHSGSGGGISTDTFLDSGTYLGAVRRCHFRLNIAGIEGGAFYSESANSVLRNCLIENNYAAYGGGVKTSGTVESCTIVSNTAVANGGGIITRGPLHNTIIYHNEAGAGRNHWIEEEEPDVTFCCTFPSIPGTGNFASDPLFIDLANGDFRLSPSSPCVNVGTNQDWMTGALDFYEENRIEHSDVDIGAAELQADTPLCDFAVDVRSGFIPMSVTFTAALNNIPTADLLYQWDFDNDGTIDEEGVGLSNVAHVYTASGAYSPALTVSSVAAGMHSKVREAFIMAGSENLYVSSGGSNTPPYASWGEAAHSISDALNAAPDGATIHIASGTYETTDQLVLDRPVTLRGVDGYETTILSGADTHHLFYLEHPDAVIEGLALINGRATLGGGLVIYGGGIARQCRIAECTASAWGGGVYSTGRASLLQDCVIEDNYAPYGGGGVWSGGGDLFEDCMIRSNSLSSQRGRFGAGVDSWGGTFLNCDISENTGSYGGAGIAMLGDTLIDGCTISNNSGTAAFSGGIMMWDGIVRNSDIRGNHGYWTGGVTMYGPGLVENCRIFDNENGGVIFDREGGTVRNCAIYQNHGRRGVILDDIGLLENCSVFNNDGGGVAAMQSGHSQPGRQAVVRNCIIWHNEASISPDLYLPDESTAGDPILENICTSEPPPTGPGHVIASPEFVDWENGDFGLLLSSPCIDAGVNQPWMDGFFVTDIDGNVRVQNGTVDIGAFETMSAVLECDLSCRQSVGTAPYTASFVSHVNGSNLIDLYYEWDFDGDGNVDAEGFGLGEVQWNYTSTGEYTVILTVTNGALETATVTKTNYVAVTPDYGAGYLYVDLDGTHSSPFSSWESAARDIQSALDVAPEGATILVNQGEYVIEETITISKSAVVQGIRGAALTTLDAEENCRVLSLSHADAEVVGFTIRRGRAGQGGGVYFSGGGLVSDCILRENEATGYTDAGGAAFLNNGGTLDRCLIENNWAKGEGGGVQIDVDGVVKNCLIRGNVSTAYWAGGGGIYMEDGGAAYNCTVVDNETSEDGGGICIDSWGSGGIARNCIVWNNTASGNGDNAYGHSSRFEYCCIEGYTADGTGNTTNAPAFVDLEAGDYRLLPSSPCIDTGTNMDWMASATDLEGNPRINFGLVDMGTYEFSIPGYTVFDVESIHGTPEPPVGLNHLEIGSNIVCSVTDSPVTIGATQYVCTGWIGSGDVTSGNGTNFMFTLTTNSTVGWQWQTNYWLDLDIGAGLVDVPNGWYPAGTTIVATVTLPPDRVLGYLTGTNGNCTIVGNQITIPMDQPLSFNVHYSHDFYVNDGSTTFDAWCTAPGDDANDGTTPATPKATVQALLEAHTLGTGDVVRIDTGTYVLTNNIEVTSADEGSSLAPVVFEASPYGVTLDRNNTGSGSYGWYLNHCDYVTLRTATGTNHPTATQSWMKVVGGQYGMRLNYANYCTLERMEVTSNLYMGIHMNESDHTTYSNCLVRANGSVGVYLDSCSYNTLANCTIAGNGGNELDADDWGISHLTVRNSILVADGTGDHAVTLDDLPDALNWDYNCLVALNGAQLSNVGSTLGDWQSATGEDANSISSDPAFVNPAGGDYQLQEDSPCINAGDPAYASTNAYDLAGNPRIIGGIVDIGAFEFENPDALRTTPNDGMDSSGYEGGSFSPSNKVYTLTNTGGSNLMWGASWSNAWLSVSPTNGTLAVGGTTNVTVSLTVAANSLPPGTNTDTVVFSNLTSGATRSRNVELIVNERVLDHFAWKPISLTQYVGQAFPVTITARDVTTNVLTTFADAVNLLSLYSGSAVPTNTLFDGTAHEDTGNPSGAQTRGIVFTVTNDITITHIRYYSGNKVSLWENDGTLLHSSSVVRNDGVWQEVELPSPVELYSGNTYRVACYNPSVIYWYTTSLPVAFEDGTIDASCWESSDTFPDNDFTSKIDLIDIVYVKQGVSLVGISPTNTGSFVNGVWTGNVTVLDVATNMVLQADDGSEHTGDSNPFNVFALAGDTDGDGIPDWWELQYYGGATNANPSAICSNGVNTVLEAYIAGFVPTDPNALFVLDGFGDELWWSGIPGRVYGVWWSSNLFTGFQPLETNIPWSPGGFTDTVHTAEDKGFYKLDVKME